MDKAEISEILREVSVLLELKGENRFKCLAYANASRILETLQDDLAVLIKNDKLSEVKGIGVALTEKIIELHTTGKLAYYDELKAFFPATLLECLRVPGLGPKKVKILWEKLEIDSVGDLKLSCERGMVAKLDGFGEKTQKNILEGIANLEKYRGQFLYAEGILSATPILEALKGCSVVKRVEIAGSLRRKKEVIRDLDFLVSTSDPEKVMQLFTSLPLVEKITNQGKTKSSDFVERMSLSSPLNSRKCVDSGIAYVDIAGTKPFNRDTYLCREDRGNNFPEDLLAWNSKPKKIFEKKSLHP